MSRNTVNSQVSSIYRKLGVSSRNDAVQQATTSVCSAGSRLTPAEWGSKASSMS